MGPDGARVEFDERDSVHAGNAADYDGWAAAGAPGWSYRDVLPYFLRSEDNERGADDYHGVGGPVHVSDSRATSRVVEAYVEAALEAGYPFNSTSTAPLSWEWADTS